MRRFLAAKSNCAEGSASALLALLLVTSSPETASSDGLDPGRRPILQAQFPYSYSISPKLINVGTGLRNSTENAGGNFSGACLRGRHCNAGLHYDAARSSSRWHVCIPNSSFDWQTQSREARNAGLRLRESLSALSRPHSEFGGFRDKFNSLHTYGLAVDVYGIGRPGSNEAQLWHEIAARNGWSVLTVQHRAE